MECVICDSHAKENFKKKFREQVVVYFQCSECGHLSTSDFDTDELYSESNYFSSVDEGWKQRNERIRRYLRFLRRLPVIKIYSGTPVLDFGCGVGELVNQLNEDQFEAWGYEPFPSTPPTSERISTASDDLDRFEDGFRLITMIEVVEHLRAPGEVLDTVSSVLQSGGYLLVSTDMYKPGTHTDGWYYLNPAAGHVSIFTESSLRFFFSEHGFVPVFRLTADVWLFRHSQNEWLLPDRLYFPLSQMRVRLQS